MNFFGGPVGTVVKAQLIFVEVQLIFIYYYKGLNSLEGPWYTCLRPRSCPSPRLITWKEAINWALVDDEHILLLAQGRPFVYYL